MIGSAGIPPIVEHNARLAGTDAAGYMTESPGFSSFVLEDGAAYHTYSTTWRGLEFLMGYYPILDHAPKGRAEGPDLAALAPPPRRVLGTPFCRTDMRPVETRRARAAMDSGSTREASRVATA